jgi:hypothetical protein
LTEKEISFTATTFPNDFVRDLVSIEYNILISSENYKLLSIKGIYTHKKFKECFEKIRYERIMSKMSLIKCIDHTCKWKSCLYKMCKKIGYN